MISEHAAVHAEAMLGEGCEVGAFTVIERGSRIGRGARIGHHVVIHADTRIGDFVRIDDHAVIGKSPMVAANSAVTIESALPPAQIGHEAIIGTAAIVYRGAKLGDRVLLADLAEVRERVTIGEKTIIGWNSLVECDCRIGRSTKIESATYITAYSTVEDSCFIAPGVTTSNDNFIGRTQERFSKFKGVTVRRGARIGVGATILPGRTIGEDALVAGGSLLTRDAEPGKIVAGVPARVFRDVPQDQLLDVGVHTRPLEACP